MGGNAPRPPLAPRRSRQSPSVRLLPSPHLFPSLNALSSSFFFLFFFPTFSIFKEYVSTVFVKMTQNYYKKL